ncbi:MAG: magnesium transporter CorA family protein [Eubacteriales bacterium]|nr:magnesium transporter CorA family protein [Eubacteriales bacterium]
MIRFYRTEEDRVNRLEGIEDLQPGTWLEVTAPTNKETQRITQLLDIDQDDFLAAVDQDEKNRIEITDKYTLILVDIPAKETRHKQERYTTIPLGIIITQDYIVTVCTKGTPVLSYFHHSHGKDFSTQRQFRFVYQIMVRTAVLFQRALHSIDSKRTEFEETIDNKSMDEASLINLHELESTLVYFATSLRGNANVMNRLTRYSRLRQYPEDMELLDDAITETQQAIEMTQIFRDIIDGTRTLISSIMDNRLNEVMKRLTSITLILGVPTMISGMYGMNVDGRWMPLASTPFGFEIIIVLTLALCIFMYYWFKKKKML